MTRPFRNVICIFWGLAAGTALADPPVETIADRTSYFPKHKHQPLAGKVIGLLVADPQPILSLEGRSSATENLCFALGLHSYRWVYVPAAASPQITNLRVRAGDGTEQTYPALNMANPTSVTPWGITQSYCLVEIEVNGGKGSPADMAFVATGFKVLDGTKDFPLKVTDVVTQVKKRYGDWQTENAKSFDTAMADAQKSALQNKLPTGPRTKQDLLYLTWLPETQRIRAQFRTTVSDGSYTEVQGGARFPEPSPLPSPPPPKGKFKQAPREAPRALTRVPPPKFRVKVGTTFGIEFGMAYEIDKDGKVVRLQQLPVQSFTQVLQAPPGIGPRPGRFPSPEPSLPPPPRRPLPPQKDN